VKEDFEPYWSMSATTRLDGRTVDSPDKVNTPDMRGDAVIYLWDQIDVNNAAGYHSANFYGIPYTIVLIEPGDSDWTVTLSHEVLEMIADPDVNLLSVGPHPTKENASALFWYEVCDAVQSDTYDIDGIKVSNFVLPLYFTSEDEIDGRNDFLGNNLTGDNKSSIRSFLFF